MAVADTAVPLVDIQAERILVFHRPVDNRQSSGGIFHVGIVQLSLRYKLWAEKHYSRPVAVRQAAVGIPVGNPAETPAGNPAGSPSLAGEQILPAIRLRVDTERTPLVADVRTACNRPAAAACFYRGRTFPVCVKLSINWNKLVVIAINWISRARRNVSSWLCLIRKKHKNSYHLSI